MIKRGLQGFLKQFGYRLARANDSVVPNCGLSIFFPLIKKFGFNPEHILDVGANHASFTREAAHYFPRAHYTLVEPQEQLRVHVEDLIDRGLHIHWINAGASDQAGILPLYIIGSDPEQHFFAGAENGARLGSNRRSAVANAERNSGLVGIAHSGDGEN
jgi:hypothetical protein